MNSIAAARPRSARLDDVLSMAGQELRRAGVPSPELDARLLVCHVARLSHEEAIAEPSREFERAELNALGVLVSRRRAREPVSRILGTRAFWNHEFLIGPKTLDPRPDTETVVQAALAIAEENGMSHEVLTIADLGTGSGCILLSLLDALPNARGIGSDVCPGALATAHANARKLALAERAHFVRASWFDGLAGPFDIVVSNPPYIPSARIQTLAPEVAQHDPALALDGGHDGLGAYRTIAAGLPGVLRRGGWALLETGYTQAERVRALLEDAGFGLAGGHYREYRDLSGAIRCVAVAHQ